MNLIKDYKLQCVAMDKFSDLRIGQIYEVYEDKIALAKKLYYVIDNSGTPNLYPMEFFVVVQPNAVPKTVKRRIASIYDE